MDIYEFFKLVQSLRCDIAKFLKIVPDSVRVSNSVKLFNCDSSNLDSNHNSSKVLLFTINSKTEFTKLIEEVIKPISNNHKIFINSFYSEYITIVMIHKYNDQL